MVMLGDTTCKRHKALTKRLPEAIVGKIVTMAEEIVHWSKYRYVMYQLILPQRTTGLHVYRLWSGCRLG